MKKTFIILMGLLVSCGTTFAGDINPDVAAAEEQANQDPEDVGSVGSGVFLGDDEDDERADQAMVTPPRSSGMCARMAAAASSAKMRASELKRRMFGGGNSTPAGPASDDAVSVGGFSDDDEDATALMLESRRMAVARLSDEEQSKRQALLANQYDAAMRIQSIVRGHAVRKLFNTVKQEKARIEAEMAAMVAADAERDLSPVSTPMIDPPKTPADSEDTVDPEDTAKKKTMSEWVREHKLATSGIVAGGVAAVMSTSIMGFAFSNRNKTDAQIAAMHPLARWMTTAGLRVAHALGFKWGRKVGNLSEMASQGNNFEIGTAYQAAAAA